MPSFKMSAISTFLAGFCLLAPLCLAYATMPPDAAEDLDAEVKEFRLDDLEAKLRTMPPGAEHDYFAGVLANRAGQVEESIRLLNRALPAIRESQPARAAVALEALADDYTKSFRYSDAARSYDDLGAHFASYLKPTDDSGVVHLLQGSPPQTITWQGPVRLKTERNPIGTLDTELTVNGVREKWMLDAGSSMSLVTRSFAQRLGIKPLPGATQMGAGGTGIQNPIQVGVLPTLQMGGATLKNVVVMIFDDASFNIRMGKDAYQINAIIGYPVFQSLGAITFRQDGEFNASDAAERSATGARMYMELLKPFIECGVEGSLLPFSIDTGASSSDLSVRYYERFRGKKGTWKKGEEVNAGAGGSVRLKIYIQPKLALAIGDKTATLKRVSVWPLKRGSSIDVLYGNLGQDLVSDFESFTLDFSNMTFSLGAPLAAPH